MAVEAEAWALNAVAQTPESFRRMLARMFGDRPGILGAASWQVQAAGVAGMSVDVLAGAGIVPGNEAGFPNQGSYFCQSLTTTNVALDAPEALGRRDLIVARIVDNQYAGTTPQFSIEKVKGTASGSPVDPTVPANCLVLARITVNATPDVTIVAGDITDLRTTYGGAQAGRAAVAGGFSVCTSTARPTTNLYHGVMIYETDTGNMLVYNGSAWVLLGSQVPTSWTAVLGGVGFQNTYTNYDPTVFTSAGYRKVGDTVMLRGLLKATAPPAAPATVFTLPAGYRPLKQYVVGVDSGNPSLQHARIDVLTSGDVWTYFTSSTAGSYVSLDGIQFSTV